MDIELELTTPTDAKARAGDHGVLSVRVRRGRIPAAAVADAGRSRCSRAAGASRSSRRPASRPTTARASRSGIIGLANKGQPRKPDDWGALRAWAWGAVALLDYLETDPAVDAKRVGIEGVSRYGKAALVTMAYEPRFAIGFIGSSGMGGAKLHRRRIGELLENVAGSGEYHWMAGNYLKYAGPLTREGSAGRFARADRAVRAAAAVHQRRQSRRRAMRWVDPRGMFMAAVAAGPVYRLLGKRDLGTSEFPPIETALTDG